MKELNAELIPIEEWFEAAAGGAAVPEPFQQTWWRKANGRGRPFLKLASAIYSALADLDAIAVDEERPDYVRASATLSAKTTRDLCSWIAERMLRDPPITKNEMQGLWLAYMAAESRRWTIIDEWQPSVVVGYKLLVKAQERRIETPAAPELLEELNALKNRAPDLSLSRAQSILGEKHGISRWTLARRLNGSA